MNRQDAKVAKNLEWDATTLRRGIKRVIPPKILAVLASWRFVPS